MRNFGVSLWLTLIGRNVVPETKGIAICVVCGGQLGRLLPTLHGTAGVGGKTREKESGESHAQAGSHLQHSSRHIKDHS